MSGKIVIDVTRCDTLPRYICQTRLGKTKREQQELTSIYSIDGNSFDSVAVIYNIS